MDDGEEQPALEEAKDFLREVLSTGAEPSKEVQRQAREAGISQRTLERAKASLGIRAKKQGGFFDKKKGTAIQQWCWQLPAAEDRQPPDLGGLQLSAEKNTRNFNDLPEGRQTSDIGALQGHVGGLQQHRDSYEEGEL